MKSNTKKRKYKPEQVIKTATGENQHERFANQYHPYQHESSLKFDEITDAVGLRRAYDQGDYYVHGKTMFIAGSHTKRDWYDDFTKIPFWGDLRESNRYQKAKEQLENQGQIDTVVGHSLGGSVALELQKNYASRGIKSRTYGAPVMDLGGSESANNERYRNWLDPVSILDRGAKKSVKWNVLDSGALTHDYSNIASNKKTWDYVPEEEE